MEETWEFAVVSFDWAKLGVESLSILVFFAIFSFLTFLGVRLLRLLYPNSTKIGLEALPYEDRAVAKNRLADLDLSMAVAQTDFDYKKLEARVDSIAKFGKEFPSFIEAVKKYKASSGKKRARAENYLALYIVVCFFCAAWGVKFIKNEYFTNIPIFQSTQSQQAQEIADNVEIQIKLVQDLIGKFDTSTYSVDEISKAASSLSNELSELELLLTNQIENNNKLLKSTNKERAEVELLRKKIQVLSNLSEEEMATVKSIIFSEVRDSSSRYFWFGIGFAFLIQLFVIIVQEPFLNLIRRTKFGRRWYNPSNITFDGGQF